MGNGEEVRRFSLEERDEIGEETEVRSHVER